MRVGCVKFFDDEKGYGFIRSPDGDLFFHLKQCPNDYKPELGDELEFTPVKTIKGWAAHDIKVVNKKNEDCGKSFD